MIISQDGNSLCIEGYREKGAAGWYGKFVGELDGRLVPWGVFVAAGVRGILERIGANRRETNSVLAKPLINSKLQLSRAMNNWLSGPSRVYEATDIIYGLAAIAGATCAVNRMIRYEGQGLEEKAVRNCAFGDTQSVTYGLRDLSPLGDARKTRAQEILGAQISSLHCRYAFQVQYEDDASQPEPVNLGIAAGGGEAEAHVAQVYYSSDRLRRIAQADSGLAWNWPFFDPYHDGNAFEDLGRLAEVFGALLPPVTTPR